MIQGEPLSTLCAQFLQLQKSERTKRAYRCDLRQFLAFMSLQNAGCHALTRYGRADLIGHCSRFVESFAKHDAHSLHLTNGTTLNRKRFTLVKFFDFLIEVQEYPFNPARKLPVYPAKEYSNTPTLSKDQISHLIAAMSVDRIKSKAHFRNYLIISALFHFALRRHELVNLKWSQIYEHPIPHFQVRQKGNRWKYLPLFSKYQRRLDEFVSLHGNSGDYLFSPLKNNRTKDLAKPLSTNAVLLIVKKVSDTYLKGIPLVPHSFRATFVCLARDAGIDDKSIMNTTGQKSTRILNYYDIRSLLQANAVHHLAEIFV
ncbi:tyrosine-type recombinase/integrase [Acanthopleuribacter pedis]|uniref:Site-specific integrase n=1 Tax=Acanthopleuribacter pedis TaxID=442870 RepID=A0A8J7U5F2_9BACT|nr:site-specific integrase [Acanthopleuribacter pedis]MBO1322488.1 site-specific integrase [Acanthopleuribacter pedis]